MGQLPSVISSMYPISIKNIMAVISSGFATVASTIAVTTYAEPTRHLHLHEPLLQGGLLMKNEWGFFVCHLF